MLEDILVPLGICVVMPVMIVWLVFRSRNHTLDRKTEVMIKAIENGQEVDPSLFSSVSADAKASKTLKMQLMSKLQGGIITLLIGLTLLVVGLCGIDAAAGFQRQDLRLAVSALSEAERIVVLLFYMEDKTVKDIEAITGMPSGTVRSHLFRARKHLREYLDRLGYGRP